MNARGSAAETLLARINRQLEEISETQHRLARAKTVLQEQATQLRLGAPALEVRLALRRAGVLDGHETPTPTAVVARAA
jgi:hypothetical protein